MFCILNESPEYRRTLSFRTCLVESIQITCLHITSGMSMWINLYKKGIKWLFINRFTCQGLLQHSKVGKVYNGAGLLLHKRKDAGAQWIYHYTTHERRREMGLGALQNVS